LDIDLNGRNVEHDTAFDQLCRLLHARTARQAEEQER
jgi:hypothetical protein